MAGAPLNHSSFAMQRTPKEVRPCVVAQLTDGTHQYRMYRGRLLMLQKY